MPNGPTLACHVSLRRITGVARRQAEESFYSFSLVGLFGTVGRSHGPGQDCRHGWIVWVYFALEIGCGTRIGVCNFPNDGWHILRKVVSGNSQGITSLKEFPVLSQTLSDYLSVELGGGPADKQRATDLFPPRSSLITAGAADPDHPPSELSAPAETFLETSF